GAVQVQPTSAGVDSTAGSATASLQADQALGDILGADLSGAAGAPADTNALVVGIAHAPLPHLPVTTASGPLIDAGTLQITGGGDDVQIDLGSLTVRITSLSRDPQLAVGILGTQLEFAAPVQVGDGVQSTATDSLGTAQAGSGNTATNSIGTAQV